METEARSAVSAMFTQVAGVVFVKRRYQVATKTMTATQPKSTAGPFNYEKPVDLKFLFPDASKTK